ncbi:MAG: 16S rRNA (guanine(966)-N(2))-methyltransferase RsmD [Bdellovibrionota bacterium]|nr:16S rRNA (guanine(966)-N(2))-methyltransferase RsmD [Deltaproteobacteria bacterium]
MSGYGKIIDCLAESINPLVWSMRMFESRMFLKIGAGKLKGRTFDGPKGGKTVRPISDRVKEALFDILAAKFDDAIVLDLFTGTGAIAFEALSRGAKKVVCVEHDRRNVMLIKKNAEDLTILDQISVLHGPLPAHLKKVKGVFDLIFMDPPFALDIAEELFPMIAKQNLLQTGGTIILQRDRRSKTLVSDHFVLAREHRVGDSILHFYQHLEEVK